MNVGDLELFVPAGDSAAVGTRVYVYGGHPVAELNATSGLTWLLDDAQGTSYATVNAANLAVTNRWQDPYGTNRGVVISPCTDKHGYLGGYQNTTGPTHLGARDYDPAAGRFISVDPILDGSTPQQLNGYAYGFGNPTTNTDPTGMEPMLDTCKGSDMVACMEYYYGSWDAPELQHINLSAAITHGWSSHRMRELGVLGLRQSERYYHPSKDVKLTLKSFVGVVANILVFAGCEVATGPESGGLSTVGCGVLAGASGGGAQAAIDGDNILDAIGEGGLLGLLEGIGSLSAKALAAKTTAKVGGDASGDVPGEPAGDTVGNGGKAVVAPGKYDYIFGRVASNAHNKARSIGNLKQLTLMGIRDNPEGRQILTDFFDQQVASDSNLASSFTDQWGDHQVRDGLLIGPYGFAHAETTWNVIDGELQLSTLIFRGQK